MLLVEKPPAEGHHFEFEDGHGGRMEGRAIDTLGYRGMHSYEVAFDNWSVPAENLVGGEAGLGRGFSCTWRASERTAADRRPVPSA